MKAFCQRAEEKNVFTFSILLSLLLLLFVFLSTLGQKASNAKETNKETNKLCCNNVIMAGLTKQPSAITLKSFKVVLLFFLQLFCNADFLKKLHALKAFGETVQSTFCTPLQKKKKSLRKSVSAILAGPAKHTRQQQTNHCSRRWFMWIDLFCNLSVEKRKRLPSEVRISFLPLKYLFSAINALCKQKPAWTAKPVTQQRFSTKLVQLRESIYTLWIGPLSNC